MATLNVNPYEPSSKSVAEPTPAPRRWPAIITAVACFYYGISAVTLPFANAVWFGEAPLLALFQIPKSFIKSVAQNCLVHTMRSLGLSHGSPSPDYIATDGWAMLVMLAAPALLLVAVLAFAIGGRMRNRLIAAVLLFAVVDALVSVWFDWSVSLKIY